MWSVGVIIYVRILYPSISINNLLQTGDTFWDFSIQRKWRNCRSNSKCRVHVSTKPMERNQPWGNWPHPKFAQSSGKFQFQWIILEDVTVSLDGRSFLNNLQIADRLNIDDCIGHRWLHDAQAYFIIDIKNHFTYYTFFRLIGTWGIWKDDLAYRHVIWHQRRKI